MAAVLTCLEIATAPGGAAASSATPQVAAGGSFHPAGPRLVDTRYGIGAPARPLTPHETLVVALSGNSVTLNVVATQPTASGYLTVFTGSLPGTSSLNFRPHQTIGNLVTVSGVASSNSFSIYNGSSGTVQVVVDEIGNYAADASGWTLLYTTTARIADTRNESRPLAAGEIRTFNVSGWLPDTANAMLANVTVVNPAASGHLFAYSDDAAGPTDWLNFTRGQTLAQAAVLPIGPDRLISIQNASNSPVNVILDLAGGPFSAQGNGATFYPDPQKRWIDTRSNLGTTRLGANGSTTVALPAADVPSDALGVVLNVTVTRPTGAGWLRVGECCGLFSSLNFVAGQTVANQVTVPTGDAGQQVDFFNANSGSVDLVVDEVGYYSSGRT